MTKRNTPIKSIIRQLFSVATRPISAIECLDTCRIAGLNPNKTTIYRELKKKIEAGEIDEVVMEDGVKRYELSSKTHGHCLVCEGCGDVKRVELPDDLRTREREIESKTNFQIIRHDLTFYGRCKNCQS